MRRSRMVLAALALALVAMLAIPASASAQAKDDDCQAFDTGFVPNPLQATCDAAEAVIDQGPGAVTDVATAPIQGGGRSGDARRHAVGDQTARRGWSGRPAS